MTHDCWFRLTTTLLGINVVDTFQLAKFHGFLPQGRVGNLIPHGNDTEGTNEITMQRFAGILSTQLLYKAYNYHDIYTVNEEDLMTEPLNPKGINDNNMNNSGDSSNGGMKLGATTSFISGKTDHQSKEQLYTIGGGQGVAKYHDVSSLSIDIAATSDDSYNTFHESDSYDDLDMGRNKDYAIEVLKDCNGGLHSVMKLKSAVSNGTTTKGKIYINPRQCMECGKLTRVKCYQCNEIYCYPLKDKKNIRSYCFYKHVKGICKMKQSKRRRLQKQFKP